MPVLLNRIEGRDSLTVIILSRAGYSSETCGRVPKDARKPPRHLTLFAHRVPDSFPSPAEEYAEGTLDLNRHLVTDADATTFVRVPDAALQARGIRAGDLLVIQAGLPPRPGDLVWAELDGERLLRELRRQGSRWWLHAHHPDFPPIHPGEGQELRILGVATAMVRALPPFSGISPLPQFGVKGHLRGQQGGGGDQFHREGEIYLRGKRQSAQL